MPCFATIQKRSSSMTGEPHPRPSPACCTAAAREPRALRARQGSEETRATGMVAALQKLEEERHAADDARSLAEERMRVAETHLPDRGNDRERAGVELDRFERDLQVASDERTLYV